MIPAIDRERLAATFVRLCETDSPSRREGAMARLVTDLCARLQPAWVFEDDSQKTTGSECGNLFFRFTGTTELSPLFFNCHLDTVEPGRGIRVQRTGDLFTSAGDTILGSDDKSGIAALIEAMTVIREHNLDHRPVEYVFTTCEEIGLLGAKALDPSLIQAKMGYALDSSGMGRVITGAPASNRLRIKVSGVAAHAGLNPEQGVSAIMLAARALAQLPCGRMDEISTVNFGTIKGGVATNIVAPEVVIEGEIRSHDQQRLDELSRQVESVFSETVSAWKNPDGLVSEPPNCTITTTLDFPLMRLEPNAPVLREIGRAASRIGMDLRFETSGGGSDANIFNGYGLETAIIATGMTNVHSTNEQVHLDDMEKLTRLIVALLTG